MLQADDFDRIIRRINTQAYAEGIPEQLEAWGIDLVSFDKLMNDHMVVALHLVANDEQQIWEAIRTAFWCGFELGFLSRLEIEMRSINEA